MSRIGKQPITIPEGVTVEVQTHLVKISGQKGEVFYPLPPEVSVDVREGKIFVARKLNSRFAQALHGTTRANLANAVKGVSEGHEKSLILDGLGYKAKMEGSEKLVLEVGFSHPVEYRVPEGVTVQLEGKNELRVSGVRKDLVGRVAADIRAIRPPEPYKGKGIRYKDEVVRRKPGKAAKMGEGA